MAVIFQKIKNEKIKSIFLDVLEDFKSLHDCDIILRRRKLTSATMMAQPDISIFRLFGHTNRYVIFLGYHIRDKEDLIIAKVPETVLRGWFAHEFAHLVDYRQYSNIKMVFFGLKYLFSAKFRKKVEHDADYIAIKYGFFDEILATKDYILNHELIEEKYKRKIKKYYLPREKVLICANDKSPLKPYLHL